MSSKKREPLKLKAHELCDLVPKMNALEFEELKASIKERGGLLEPITKMGRLVIDGRHRLRACRELGIKLKPKDFVEFVGDEAAIAQFVIDKNLARRHLGYRARAEVVKQLLKQSPETSNRVIGAAVGLGREAVRTVRLREEAKGAIPKTTIRRDARGKAHGEATWPKKRGSGDRGAEHVSTADDLAMRRVIRDLGTVSAARLTAPQSYLDMLAAELDRLVAELRTVNSAVAH